MEDSLKPLPLVLQSFGISCAHETTLATEIRLRTVLYNSLVAHLSYDPFFDTSKPDFREPLGEQQKKSSSFSDDTKLASLGRPCGHVFGRAETVYRCRTCGMDDTCVMCQKCYRSSNHEDHDIIMSISGGSGGCCDCGDPEAWKVEMKCTEHYSENPIESAAQPDLPEAVKSNIRNGVVCALDFILDVMTHARDSAKPPPDDNDNPNNPIQAAISARFKSPEYDPHLDAAIEDTWSTVLWNDEKHNFAEVIDIVKRACNSNTGYGTEVANMVDSRGRSTVYTGSYAEAVRIAKFLSKIRLGVTVRCARDVFREDMVEFLLDFLRDAANLVVYTPDGRPNTDFIRRAICEELCKPWRQGVGPDQQSYDEFKELLPMVDSEDDDEAEDEDDGEGDDVAMLDLGDVAEIVDLNGRDEQMTTRAVAMLRPLHTDANEAPAGRGWALIDENLPANRTIDLDELLRLNGYPLPTAEHETIHDEEQPTTADSNSGTSASFSRIRNRSLNPIHWQLTPKTTSQTDRTRLRHLFIVDLRLWKMARTGLRELYITTMVAIPYFKREMGIQFAQSYKQLTEAFLFADREPEQSMVLFAVQIFTVPSIALVLVQEYDFLTTLLAVCYTYYSQHKLGLPSEVNTIAYQDNDVYSFKSRRHYHIVNDLRWLLCTTAVQKIIPSLPNVHNQFLDWLELFQGQNPQQKVIGDHVEYESMSYNAAFGIMMQIAKQAQWFARTFEFVNHSSAGPSHLFQVMKECTSRLVRWARGHHRPYRPKFEPRGSIEDEVSLHHPLHWLLAGLAGYLQAGDVIDFLPSVDVKSGGVKKLIEFAQYPLKVIHMTWEARCNIWVRNGQSIQMQVYRYTDVDLREYCYDKDVQFVQLMLASAGCSPRNMRNILSGANDNVKLYNSHLALLDRIVLAMFEIFHGANDPQYAGGDMSRILMQDYMMHFLVIIFAERGWLLKCSTEESVRVAIRHSLVFGPKTFSEVSKCVNDDKRDEVAFIAVLESLTTFKPPVGLEDVGHYVLKDSELDAVDPYYHRYSLQQIEEANDILGKRGKADQTAPDLKLQPMPGVPWNGLFDFVFCDVLQGYIQSFFATLISGKLDSQSVSLRDSVTDKVLHLLNLALQQEQQYQIQGIETVMGLRPETFEYYLKKDLRLVPQLKAHKKKLAAFYDKLYCLTGDPDGDTPTSRSPTKREHIWNEAEVEMTDFARKKALAKARQAKLMTDMKASQDAFIGQHASTEFDAMDLKDEAFEVDNEDDRLAWRFPTGNCIICQNAVQIVDGTYGVLSSFHATGLDRKIPDEDDYNQMAVALLEHPLALNQDYETSRAPLNFRRDHIRQRVDSGTSYSMTSCGHIMHWSCYTPWVDTLRLQQQNMVLQGRRSAADFEFQCPLCKTVGNSLMPIVSTGLPGESLGTSCRVAELEGSLHNLNETHFHFEPLKGRDELVHEKSERAIPRLLGKIESCDTEVAKVDVIRRLNTKGSNLPVLKEIDKTILGKQGTRYVPAELEKNDDGVGVFGESLLSEALIRIFASSIMDVEISLRDRVHNDNRTGPVTTLIEGMSEQNHISLKVQISNIHARLNVLAFQDYIKREVSKNYDQSLASHVELSHWESYLKRHYKELFDMDSVSWSQGEQKPSWSRKGSFEQFVTLALTGSFSDVDVGCLANTFLLSELVKVLIVFLPRIRSQSLKNSSTTPDYPRTSPPPLSMTQISIFHAWCVFVLKDTEVLPTEDTVTGSEDAEWILQLFGILQRFALIFLRRYALFVATARNIKLPTELDFEPVNELQTLSKLLHVPALEDLLMWGQSRKLARSWIRGCCNRQEMHTLHQKISWPLPFAMAPLPHALDQLFERCQYYECPRCETVPSAPALCLLCNTIVCYQSLCCSDLGSGECTIHQETCGVNIGIFLIVKRCALLIMRGDSGSFGPAPYLDVHGERDLDLRRGRPQFLNKRRYEIGIRQMYLQHQVGTWLARKWENSIDMGGWETL